MERIWLNSYPQGMPTDIDPDQYSSLVELFERSCQQYAQHRAVSNMGSTLTYAELDTLTANFAAYLQHELKLQKGDRLAIMMPNVLQYFITLFGALRAGLVVVNVNPLYTKRELAHQLTDSGARTIVIMENFAHTLQKALPEVRVEHIILTAIGDCFSFPKSFVYNVVSRYVKKLVPTFQLPSVIPFTKCLRRNIKKPLQSVDLKGDDLAFLQYTGGTTGQPKGAMLTHRNIVANVLQTVTWAGEFIEEANAVVVTPLPLYHIFSLTLCCFGFVYRGNEVLLITNPRDLDGMVKTLSKTRWTMIVGINTLYNALINHPRFQQLDFSELKIAMAGGAATTHAVAEGWQKLTGVPLLEGYGLTETSPVVAANRFDLTQYTGTIGLPMPSTEVSIQDNDGQSVAIGEPGELCVKGPQVMHGYWHNDAETQAVIDDQGWFHTGDIAVMDTSGYLKIVDRKKNMVLVSGFNVYPNEVESVLMELDGVLEAAVIGVPDPETGEKVKAVIVKKDPNLTEEQVKAHCRLNLTNYKRPKLIEFVAELPKTPIGKVLHRELREAHQSQL